MGIALVLVLQMLSAGVVANHTPEHNNAPVIEPVADVVSPEKQLLQVEMNATDPDGDNIVFEAVTLPPGASFEQLESTSATLSWVPSYSDAGSHLVTFKVRDEFKSVSESFYINITDVNRAPYLDVIRNDWIDELEDFSFQVKAYDPDTDDSLSYALESIPTPDHNDTALPAGVRFADGDDNNAAFAWTPDCTQGAPFDALNGGGKRYQFLMNVTDGDANHTRQFNITVYHVDTAPVLHSIPFQLAVEGTTLAFKVSGAACDLENHTLDVGLNSATQAGITPPPLPSPLPNPGLPEGVVVEPERPNNMHYDNVTETYFSNFTWVIHFQQAGNYTFYADMADAQGNADNISFVIKIVDNNTAPIFDTFPVFDDPANNTFWAKEDTRFNMTAPLGFYGAEHPGAGVNTTNGAQRFDCFSGGLGIPCGDTIVTGATLTPQACLDDPAATCVDAGLPGYPTGFTCDWANLTYPIPCGTPFVVTAKDKENDTLFWNLEWLTKDGKIVPGKMLPAGMQFIAPGTDPGSGASYNGTGAAPANESFALIRWIPGYDQAGSYTFRLWVTDGALLAEKTITIAVENTNRRPVLPAPQSHIILEGDELKLDFTGVDVDFLDAKVLLRDDMAFTAHDLPPGAQFQPGRDEQDITFHGAFRWVPGFHHAGFYNVTLRADDSDDHRLFPSNPLGTGSDISPDLYLEAPYVFPTPWLDNGLLTEFANQTWFNITVLNVDRPPVLDAIPDVSYQSGATVNLLVHAEDPDGDNITVSVAGLPSAVNLVNDSVGPGWFDGRLFGTAIDGGVHTVTVTACSGFPLVCTSETFLLIVIVDTDFEINPEKSVYDTTPNTNVLIPVRIDNTGPANPDIINFGVAITDGTIVSYVQNVTVGSTDSGWANITVNLPAGVTDATLTITGTSTIDPGFTKIAQVQVRVHPKVEVVVTQTLGGVSGYATVLFADGSAPVATPATATQSPSVNPFGSLSSTVGGHVNSTGHFNWGFGAADAKATAPGTHTVTVTVEYGGKLFTGTTTYRI